MARGRDSRTFRRLAANLRATKPPCHLCGQPIRYDVDPTHPDSFTIDHHHPLTTHPHLAEDPTNLQPAHRRCNSHKSNRPAQPATQTSEPW